MIKSTQLLHSHSFLSLGWIKVSEKILALTSREANKMNKKDIKFTTNLIHLVNTVISLPWKNTHKILIWKDFQIAIIYILVLFFFKTSMAKCEKKNFCSEQKEIRERTKM